MKALSPARLAAVLFLASLSAAVAAPVVVSNDTDQALRTALQYGGTVTFNRDCSITVTQVINITAYSTVLDAGGYAVTISGGGTRPIFNVSGNLTLKGVTLANGRATNGAALYINAGASVLATNCVFAGNIAKGTNGTAGAKGANTTATGKPGGDGSPGIAARGGAIYNLGSFTALYCRFLTNSATGGTGGNGGNGGDGGGSLSVGGDGGNGGNGGHGYGGGIYSSGGLVLRDCRFSGNSAAGGSGGAGGLSGAGYDPGKTGSGGAGAEGSGAGVYSASSLQMANCTFDSNSAQGGNSAAAGTDSSGACGAASRGGGVVLLGSGAVTNCTFYGNKVIGGSGGNGGNGMGTFAPGGSGGNGGDGMGGAFHNAGSALLLHCTLASCTAVAGTNGIGGSGYPQGASGSPGQALGGNLRHAGSACSLQNSILASGTPNCGSRTVPVTDAGHNLLSDASLSMGNTSLLNTDPKLSSLAISAGGLTPTMALQLDSPARDQIPASACCTADQRGVPRPVNLLADIGACEYESAGKPVISRQPLDQYIRQSSNATLSVATVGAGPFFYRWFFNDTTTRPDWTNSTLAVNSFTPTNVGAYFVVVSNAYGPTLSDSAHLMLDLPAPVTLTLPTSESPMTNFAFTFPAESGYTYIVDYKDDLTNSLWLTLTNFVGAGADLTVTDFGAITNTNRPSRFYRVRAQ